MANDGDSMDAVSASSTEPWTIPRLRELGVKLRPVNVLAHGQLCEPVDVARLALLVRNADYKKRGFGALVLRFSEPKGSVLVYKSGKFVVVGSKTPEHAKKIADKLTDTLRKVEYPSRVTKYDVANVVNATDLRFPLRLEGLAHSHARHCQYEPELFPGLIYRIHDPKVTVLAFVSGKIVITGAKSQEDAERAICKLFPVLLLYRMHRDDDDEYISSSDDGEQDEEGDDEGMRDVEDEDSFIDDL